MADLSKCGRHECWLRSNLRKKTAMVNEVELERTSEFWGSDSGRWRTEKWEHWLQHPRVQQRLNVLTTGDLHKDRYANFVDRFFRTPVRSR
jgi:hypothetical protein